MRKFYWPRGCISEADTVHKHHADQAERAAIEKRWLECVERAPVVYAREHAAMLAQNDGVPKWFSKKHLPAAIERHEAWYRDYRARLARRLRAARWGASRPSGWRPTPTWQALTDLSGAWIDRVHERKPPDSIILDMDSSESPTHGEQEGSAWNGHFGCTCYHPLFVFNQFGDLERCLLRPGNVHSAEDWRLVLEPVIARYRERGVDLYFRADAAFAKPEIYELLEAEGIRYAIRLPANQVLQRRIGHLLTRPVGRPPKKPIVSYASFRYQAKGWTRARRVVAKVEWHQGELYPRVGFIVTNLTRPNKRVVKFYNGRGTAEQWIKIL